MQDQNSSLRGFSQEDSYSIAREDGTGWETTTKVLAKICAESGSFENALRIAQEWDEYNEPPWGDKLEYQITRLWNFVHSGEPQSFNNLPVRRLHRPGSLAFETAEAVVAKYGAGAATRIRRAGQAPPNARNALDFILPGNPWIGISQYQPSDQQVFRRSQIAGLEERYAWLCPNPFRARQVKVRGKWSMKCDANVLERRHLVIEFDLKERNGWGPSLQKWNEAKLSALDVHGGLFLWIAAATGLAPFMVVFSGSVSYHAWYDVRELSEDQCAELVQLTLPFGGDPASLTPSQLFRMPGGTRLRKNMVAKKIIRVRQEVVFWNPYKT